MALMKIHVGWLMQYRSISARFEFIQVLQNDLRFIVQLFPSRSDFLLIRTVRLEEIALFKYFLVDYLVQPSVFLVSVVFIRRRVADELLEQRGPFRVELIAHCLNLAKSGGWVSPGKLHGRSGRTS